MTLTKDCHPDRAPGATAAPSPPAADDSRVVAALEAYVAALETGSCPDRAAFLARYPDIAEALDACLDGLEFVYGTGPQLAPSGMDDATSPNPAAAVPLGDFRILREVGRGGMGIVYEAEQLSLGRRVALKVLPFAATMDPRQLRRFQNEARAAAGLHHTNIVPVYFVGSERGVHYYAMQFIDGQDLASVMDQRRAQADAQEIAPKPMETEDARAGQAVTPTALPGTPTRPIAGLSTERAPRSREHFRTLARLGIQAAEALDHAHQQGIVHRDIKPANLLVDADGRLWVTDFGLAHIQSDARLTMSGDLVGTLRYMSPEQALAKRVLVDHRTDIYSLGATLYELLTLEPVFAGTDRHELLRQIAFEEPKAPRRINKSIPPELETIVLKALEKNPSERYATARDLADDLERFLKDQPIRARRASLIQRARRWARRHQTLVASAVVALIAGLGVLVATETRRAEGERQAKEVAQARAAETDAVLDFVEKRVLAAARSEEEGGLGHNVSLRKGIDAALPFIATSFPNQPLIEARLRVTVGRTLHDLGESRKAAEQFETAVGLYLKHRGPDDPDTLKCTNNLAASYHALGRYTDALKLNEETLTLYKAKFGADHPNTLREMNDVAVCYEYLGRQTEALKLREEILPLIKTKLGADHPVTLRAMNNVARSYHALGRYPDALKLYEATLAIQKAKLGAHDLATLDSLEGLAFGYDALGRKTKALKLREETLAVRRAKLAPHHPHTLVNMLQLAQSYGYVGRIAEAIKLNQETLLLMKAKLGPYHPHTLATMVNLAEVYEALGRQTDARKFREETLVAKLARGEQGTLGMVHSWLVLSEPLPFEGHDGTRALDQEQIPGEALIHPREGDRVEIGGKKLTWKQHHTNDVSMIDFKALYGTPCEYKLTYAVCYVHADDNRTDLVLRVNSDDQAKVYLNGKEVYRYLRTRGVFHSDEDEVKPVTLRKGSNVIVFKVVNELQAWDAWLRFVDKDGCPAKGLRFGIGP